MKPFVTCVRSWLDDNCKPEDETDYIMNTLETFQSYYCDGNKADTEYISSKYM